MKKIFTYLASAALVLAASCNKIEEVNTPIDTPADNPVETPAETETITVQLNPGTKTSLGEDGIATLWSQGDAVDVTTGGTYLGTLDNYLVNVDTFSGEVIAGIDGGKKITLIYPAGSDGCVPTEQEAVENSFAERAAVLEGTTTMADLRAGNPVTMKNMTALLKFSVAQAGDVTFKVGEANYTVTGCKTDKIYYACVEPCENASLNYTIGEAKGTKSKDDVTFNAGEIYNLDKLNVIITSDYGVVGSFQAPTSWDVAAPVKMVEYGDGWAVAENVELYKDDEFKFVTGNSWDNPNFGISEVKAREENVEVDAVKGGQNMKVSRNGKYNLYLKLDEKKVKIECVETYTDLKVNITIDNKANWSPLYITLKDGNTEIVKDATVTGNKYEISGDYIGKTLTCTLSNGSKTSQVMSVAITKTGATVTLEETIIKLKIQLNTDNSKQWWGNTMKIHAWNTGTSFDTSWPGNTMTSEGNYTWSIIVPSELVGKTINFLVHNGNGWQSSDSKVTIKAEGNTVTGSSIGIN